MKFLSDILAKAGLVVDGTVTLNSVANATTDTDRFIVVESGVVKYRTGTQLLSDIGGISGNQTITLSGDATGSGTTSIAVTLANSGVVAGTYGSSTAVPVITVDAKGRVTGVTTASISGSLTFTGDVTGSGTTGSTTTLTLANSGVTAGTYTKVTVDAKGRVTTGTTLSAGDIPSLNYLPISGGTLTGNLIIWPGTNASYGAGLKFRNDGYAHYTVGVKGNTFVLSNTGADGSVVWSASITDLITVTSAGNVTTLGSVTASSIIKSGGTSSQFLKADGSIDSTTYQSTSQKGQANGYASLDGAGKVPVSQLPSSIMEYKGTWNASTNSPTLADGTGDTGDVYRVSTAGTRNLGSGSITFDIGDYVIYNGTVWEKSDTTDAVASVNGLTGVVVLTTTNIGEGTNLYYTDARARAALSFTAGSGAYNSTTGVITIPTNTNQLTNGAGFITGYTETDTLSTVVARGNTTSTYISVDYIITTNNGNGTNVRIGDDLWMGDVNLANTVRFMGLQNNANAYIIFGNGDSTALGRSGTGALTYGGNTVYHAGNLTNLNQLTNGPGYITGNQNITLSGDVTGSGATSIVTTIANNAVTTAKINNSAVTAAKLATFGAGEGIYWSANTDGASILFESTGDGASGGRALSNLVIALSDNGDEGLKVTSAGTELFYVNTNQLQYKGNNIWTAANLTNLNQLTNGPGYITGNQSITLSGDVSGSGTTAITVTLANSGVTAGTYRSVTVDAKGRVTSGTNPTTISGYGITDFYAQVISGFVVGANTSVTTTDSLEVAIEKLQGQINARLSSNQTITLSGDATGSGSTAIAVTLANSGVTAGTYTKVTVDAKGRVTLGASLASADLPTYTGTLTSSQVTTALGYTPYNAGSNTVLTNSNYTSYALRWNSTSSYGSGLNNTTVVPNSVTLFDGYGAPVPGYPAGAAQWWVGALTIGDANRGFQIAGGYADSDMYFRKGQDAWQSWRKVWTDVNLTNLNQLTNGPGYITGNQTITISGDASGSGTTSIAVTVNRLNNRYTTADANSLWEAGVYTFFNGTNVPGGDFGMISIPTWGSTNSTNRYNLQIGSGISGNPVFRTTDINGAGTWRTIWHSGNLTNLNQLTNGPGYITSYTETDTLATVTNRGNTTTGRINVRGAGNQGGGNILMGNTGNGSNKWSYLTGTHYNQDTQTQGVSIIGAYSDLNSNTVVIGGSIYEANPATEIQFWTHTATTHNLGGSKRMVIDTNGNVGINVNSPSNKFQIGSIGSSGYGGNDLVIGNGTQVFAIWQSTISNIYTNTNFAFQSAGGGSGNLNVGYSVDQGYKFAANGTGYFSSNLTVGGTITEQSALKYKENIAPVTAALEKVDQLQPVSYNKKGSSIKEIGLIAEDVFDVYPEFVLCDDNGEPVGIHYSRLTAVLIESVKELKKEINELKNRN